MTFSGLSLCDRAGKGNLGKLKNTKIPLSRPITLYNNITIVISNEVRNLFLFSLT
jgi:hypothetical protein